MHVSPEPYAFFGGQSIVNGVSGNGHSRSTSPVAVLRLSRHKQLSIMSANQRNASESGSHDHPLGMCHPGPPCFLLFANVAIYSRVSYAALPKCDIRVRIRTSSLLAATLVFISGTPTSLVECSAWTHEGPFGCSTTDYLATVAYEGRPDEHNGVVFWSFGARCTD